VTSNNLRSGSPRRAADNYRAATVRYSGAQQATARNQQQPADANRTQRHRPRYKTHNGIYVRSKIEKIIADFLHDEHIRFVYEPVLRVNGARYRPDFYLPHHGLYYEHFGMQTPDYRAAAEAKKAAYRTGGIRFIYTTVDDEPEIEDAIVDRLTVATLR
jgi:hypothetical protein